MAMADVPVAIMRGFVAGIRVPMHANKICTAFFGGTRQFKNVELPGKRQGEQNQKQYYRP